MEGTKEMKELDPIDINALKIFLETQSTINLSKSKEKPTMDEFATKIMQERIKTCKGTLPPDEYAKYCKEILRTYTDYAIKGSTLCQLLYKKRPKSFTSGYRILTFEKHVRKKPQWTTFNES